MVGILESEVAIFYIYNVIISKQIIILINRGNLPYYLKINPDISIGCSIIIDVSDLPKGSSIGVNVKCDICNNVVEVPYKLYNKRMKDHNSFACSKKCSSLRLKEKLQREYGVSNIAQTPIVKEKILQTNLKKYGSEYFIGSNTAIRKIKNTFIEKFGVDNPQKDPVIREKTKKTNLEKYGKEFTLLVKEIRNRIDETNLEKWGYIHPSKSKLIKDKTKLTNQLKYGGNSPMCDSKVREKSINTLKLNHKVSSVFELISTNETYRKRYEMCKHPSYLSYIGNGISLFKCDCDKDHNFEISSDNYINRIKWKNPLCTICYPIGEQKSIKERELLSYIISVYSGQVISSYRDGMEIDIYLPELKIGFEFNGLYWHSELFKDKNYHLTKTNYFKERGIRIIHIWEDDWLYKQDIVKSQIKNIIGVTNNKIYARECEVREIEYSTVSNPFLDDNHIQGKVGSCVKMGLYYNDELVSLMTFDHFEGRKKLPDNEWNLSRFCNKIGTNVVGGFSRLLKGFIDRYKPKRIISYADKSWSVGMVYLKFGFNIISESNPDYKYIVNDKRVTKSRFRKSKLGIKNLTESEYMKLSGIEKIYDCGKIKFEKWLIKKTE